MDIPFVSPEKIKNMRSKGLQMTNPADTLASISMQNFAKNEGGDFNPFSFAGDELKRYRQFANNLNTSQGLFTSSNFDIFRSANTYLYRSDPHTAISNLMDSYKTDHARFAWFDIETLGDMDKAGSGMFTPTEIHFNMGAFDQGGRWLKQKERTYLVRPSQTVYDNIRNMLKRTANNIAQRGIPDLTSAETRTIKDLLKYADAKFKNGVITYSSDIYDQYVTGSRLTLTTLDPVQKAMEGLEFLHNRGIGSKRMAQHLQRFAEKEIMQGNRFLAGHNISNFDIRGLNTFLSQNLDNAFQLPTDRYIDTQSIFRSLYSSPLAIGRALNNKSYISNAYNATDGSWTLSGLSSIFGLGEFEAHKASADVERNIEIAGKGLYSPEARDLINRKILDNSSGHNFNLGASFDQKPLRPGDIIFATRGVRPRADDELSFRTILSGNRESVINSRHYINSQTPYEFVGQYETPEGKFGIKLRNAITGSEYSYITRNNKAELRNFIYDRFIFANEIPEDQVADWNRYAREDVARSKYRKLTNNVDIGGFGKVQRLLQAYRAEEGVRDSLLEIKGVGSKRADRIMEFIRNNDINSVEQLRKIPGIGPKTIESLKQSKAINNAVNFYNVELPGIFSFQKGDQSIVMGDFPLYFKQMRERIGSEYKLLSALTQKIEDDVSLDGVTEGSQDYWQRMRRRHMLFVESYQQLQNKIGTSKELVNLPLYKQYGIELPNFQGKTNRIGLFNRGNFSATMNYNLSRIKNLNNEASARDFLQSTIGNAQKQIEEQYKKNAGDFSKTQYNRATSALNRLANQVQNVSVEDNIASMESLGNLVGSFEDILFLNREFFRQTEREVESLSARDVKQFLRKGTTVDNLVSEAYNTASDKVDSVYQATYKNIDRIFDSSFDSQLTRTVDQLDDNLNKIYELNGISNRPATMRDSLGRLIKAVQGQTAYQDGKVSFNMYLSGGVEQPRVTFALFDSNRVDTMSIKSLKEARQMTDVATFDVPLISMDQYLYRGGRHKVISPLAILDVDDPRKALRSSDIKVKSSFDIIVDKLTNTYTLSEITKSLIDGDINRAQSLANRQVNSAIQYLSGSKQASYFDEEISLFSENLRADGIKKRMIMARNVFEADNGQWYIPYSTEQMYPSAKMDFFTSGQFTSMLRQTLGEDLNYSVMGTRGSYLAKGMLSTLDIRNFVSLGMYNDPSRPSMTQIQNMRSFTNEAVKKLDNMQFVSFNPNITSQAEFNARSLSERIAKNLSGINTNVAVVSEYDMINRLTGAINRVGSARDKELLKSMAHFPSVWENQAIMSSELAGAYSSIRPHQRAYEGRVEFTDKIKRALDEQGRYRPGYMEVIGRNTTTGEVIKNEYKSEQWLTGNVKYNEGIDESLISWEESFRAREGVTKFGVGTEKFTLRNTFSRQVLEEAFGEGVNVVINPSHQSHMAYGDVVSGLAAQAVAKINRSQEINDTVKKEKLTQIADMINRTFGFDVSVQKIGNRNDYTVVFNDSPQAYGTVEYATAKAKKKYGRSAIGLEEFVGRLNTALGDVGSIQNDVLNLETRFLFHEENLHYMSLGGFGKKGARFSAKEVRSLHYAGFTETARWLRGRIEDEAVEGLGSEFDAIIDRGRSLDYLRRMASRNATDISQGEIGTPFDIASLTARFRKDLPEGSFRGDIGRRLGQKGRYAFSSLAGTFLDPDRGGIWVGLPQEISINMAPEDAAEDIRRINRMYLPTPSPQKVGNLYVRGDVDRTQSSILRYLKEYYHFTQEKDVWQKKYGSMYDKRTVDDIISDLQRSAQRLYDTLYQKQYTSQGSVNRKLMGARLKGSGRLNVQITSPGLELTEETVSRMNKVSPLDTDLNVSATQVARQIKNVAGDNLITDPATIFVDEKMATRMLKGSANSDAILKNMRSAEGHVAVINRPPTIHGLSAVPVNIRIANQKMDPDAVRMTASLADALFADSDGDSLSFAVVEKTDIRHFRREVNRTRRMLTDPNPDVYGGMGSPQRNTIRSFLENINAPQGARIIDALSNTENQFIRRFDSRVISESDMLDQIARAKMGLDVYTGMLTNVANYYRRIGLNAFTDDVELQTFRSAIGQIIETGISSKHMFSGSSKRAQVQGVDPQEVINILRNANTEYGRQELDLLGSQGMDLLTDEQVRVMKKAAAERSEDFQSMSNYLFQSEKALSQNKLAFMNSMGDAGDTVVSPQREMYENVRQKMYTDADSFEDVVSAKRTKIKEELNTKAELKKTSEQVMRALERHMGSSFDQVAKQMPGGGLFGMALGLSAGAVGGAMATAGRPLPMDYSSGQGLQPVPDTGNRSTQVQVSDLSDLQGMDNLNYGLNISIEGMTTLDKDPEQLAGIVNRGLQESMQMPVNLSVTTTDNREDITMRWIEEKLVQAMQ